MHGWGQFKQQPGPLCAARAFPTLIFTILSGNSKHPTYTIYQKCRLPLGPDLRASSLRANCEGIVFPNQMIDSQFVRAVYSQIKMIEGLEPQVEAVQWIFSGSGESISDTSVQNTIIVDYCRWYYYLSLSFFIVIDHCYCY